MSVFAGYTVEKKDRSVTDAQCAVDEAEIILIYFAANWCPPCKTFTPILKDFFDATEPEGLIVIFVSSDRSKEDFEISFLDDHADYYSCHFGSPLVNDLKLKCQCRGIPLLIAVDKQGNEVFSDGVKRVKDIGEDIQAQIDMVREWKVKDYKKK